MILQKSSSCVALVELVYSTELLEYVLPGSDSSCNAAVLLAPSLFACASPPTQQHPSRALVGIAEACRALGK